MTGCENCQNYEYNDELEYYECLISLDEDEMEKFLRDAVINCPHYQHRDEYRIVRKQL